MAFLPGNGSAAGRAWNRANFHYVRPAGIVPGKEPGPGSSERRPGCCGEFGHHASAAEAKFIRGTLRSGSCQTLSKAPGLKPGKFASL